MARAIYKRIRWVAANGRDVIQADATIPERARDFSVWPWGRRSAMSRGAGLTGIESEAFLLQTSPLV